jgi:putative hydrolase of HD superfamily
MSALAHTPAPADDLTEAILTESPLGLARVAAGRIGVFSYGGRRWQLTHDGPLKACVYLLDDSGARLTRIYSRTAEDWVIESGRHLCGTRFPAPAVAPAQTVAFSSVAHELLPYGSDVRRLHLRTAMDRALRGANERPYLHDVLGLADMAMRAAGVQRATLHPDGVTPESNGDHVAMTQTLVIALAPRFAPFVSPERAVMLLAVHDLLEADIGDLNTFVATEEEVAKKRRAESAALDRLTRRFGELGKPIVALLDEYERGLTAEARFARLMDKIAPTVTHLLNRRAGLEGIEDADERLAGKLRTLRDTYGDEFPTALDWAASLVDQVVEIGEVS